MLPQQVEVLAEEQLYVQITKFTHLQGQAHFVYLVQEMLVVQTQ
jgi:hypothetical protein